MATATGWGALPISLSFGDSIKSLVAELNGPVAKAAKNAGGSIEKEIGNASKKAADQYEKQQWRMEKATKEKTAAEEDHRLKLLEQQRAQTALENAEKDLADAREVGGKKARDAQLRYEAAQIKVEKATIATRKASDKLDGSIDEIAKATESAEQAFKDMEKAQEDSNKESSKMGGMFDDMSGKAGKLGGALKDVVGKVGPLAAGIAGAASIGEVISLGQEAAGAIGGLNRELGLTGDEARVMGDEVGEVLRSGVVGSAEEAAEAVGALKSNFKDLSDEDLSELADNFAGFSKTFDIDITEATQTAGQLLTNGLAGDAEEAADLMTAAMQRMPKAMRDELPELTNEYGTFFSSLGYSGEDMMGMFVNVSDQGKIAMDKLGDSLKEAGIRATDLGDSGAVEALEEIGLGAEDIQNRLLAGGDTAKEAFQEMVGAIESVEDPAERAEAAVALIGTPLEDLNKAELDGFLGALSGGADAMEGFEGSSQELSDSIANSLQGRIDSLKGTVQDLAGDGFMFAWDTVSNVTGWMSGAWSDLSSTVADSEIAGKIKDTFTDVKDFAGDVVGILFNGDFDGMPFGIEEDSPIVDFLFNLRDTALDLKDRLGDIWQGIQDGIGTAIEYLQPFIDWVKDMLGDSFGDLWDSVKNIVGALLDIGKALAGGTIDLLKGFWEYAQGLWDVLSPFLVPILKVLAGIIGGALLGAIGLVVGAFRVITGVVEVFTEVIGWIAENVLAPLISKFGEVAGAIYETIGNALSWLRDHWRDIINAIAEWWDNFWGGISDTWTTMKQNVFDAIVNTLTSVRDWWNSVVDNLKLAWQVFSGVLQAVWATIRDAVVNAFINAWNNLRAQFEKATNLIGNAWQWLKDHLYATWTWIDQNVIGGFRRGMDAFKSFFEGVVDGIKNVWDGLRSALAKPINFMINTVYNGGILKAWETIRKFLPGLKEASPLAGIPEHATGGRISGPGTGTSDDVLMWGSNGEHMLTAKEVQRLGGHKHVYAMRQMVESGRPFSFDGRGDLTPLPRNPDNRAGDLYGAAPGLLPAYKDGGEIRPLWEHQLMAAHKFAQSQSGKPYQWAGPTGPGSSFDCSGFMGSIAATIQGTNPWQRYWATMSFPSPGAQGFAPGLGPGFSIGIFNGGPYGGHTAGTLGPAGPYGSVNVESGGAPSMVKYGPGAVGADHSQFTMRYHLPIGADGSFVSGGGGGISPEAMQDGLKKKVSDFVDKAMNPILSKLPVGPPEWQNIPKNVYDKGKKGMLDTAFDVVGKLGDKLASVWTAAGEVKDLVTGTVSDAASWVNDRVRSIVVRDNGGLVPNGAAAINTSGKDELMLPPSATQAFLRSVPIWHELVGAWKGIDFGYAATSEVVGDRNAIKLLDEVSWIGAAVDEMKLAQKGQDGGYSAMERYFGKTRAIEILNGIESAGAIMGELRLAFEGSDGGYAELSRYMGDNIAKSIVDGTAVIGNLWRNGIGTWRLDPELEEQARKSAEDYVAEQASGLLSTFGLEGLVPLAQKAGGMAWDAYVANPVDVAMTPNGVTAYARKQGVHAEFNRGGATVTIEAESDDDLIRVKQFKKLAEQVDGLEVQVKRKPKAAVRTRGGVM